jgi:hypothetical protein
MDQEMRVLQLERELLRLRRSRSLLLRLLEESLDECKSLKTALRRAELRVER